MDRREGNFSSVRRWAQATEPLTPLSPLPEYRARRNRELALKSSLDGGERRNHHQPPTTNHQPPTTNQQPTTNNQQPTTNNQQPTTNNYANRVRFLNALPPIRHHSLQ